MIDELMVEVQKIADETFEKWVETGPTIQESWYDVTRFSDRIGVDPETQIRTIRANFPEHLYRVKPSQVAGQRRRIFQVRLDAMPRQLLRIDISRLDDEDTPLIFALQESLYEILTQKIFHTGDGERPAQAFRALISEQIGYTFPMFPGSTAPPASKQVEEAGPIQVNSDDAPVETQAWIARSTDTGSGYETPIFGGFRIVDDRIEQLAPPPDRSDDRRMALDVIQLLADAEASRSQLRLVAQQLADIEKLVTLILDRADITVVRRHQTVRSTPPELLIEGCTGRAYCPKEKKITSGLYPKERRIHRPDCPMHRPQLPGM